ncbi:hypothetical protein [Lactiplantibacillus pentosus]|uniref:hypothetical protein n=1 Tax=Lactiplantibacillus pentosus TaxID=1589 RepID=UPI0037707342
MNDLFEKAPIPKAYFHLALPVVLGMVASMIYNLADTFFVAQNVFGYFDIRFDFS